MDSSNLIYEIRNSATGIQGITDYVVNLGSILHNDRILNISNLIIPLRSQTFFTLPDDKGKYAAVNTYYNADDGSFIFDVVRKSDTFVQNVTADALSNYLPIAQFIIQESFGSFNVLVVNQYSKMATFSITQQFEQGNRGVQGPVGTTGLAGYVGSTGETGYDGLQGYTGSQGVTGVGVAGAQGLQGTTGYYPSTDRLFYGKFKTDDLTLLDYAVYERDLTWNSTYAGITGVEYVGGGSSTGVILIPRDPSYFTVEDGIVDNCQSMVYVGGTSYYKNLKFIGNPGTIQAWVRLDVPPKADFTYAVNPINSLIVSFTDTSTLFPTEWAWDLGVGGEPVRVKSFTYTFSAHSTYVVTLRAINAAGYTERSKMIVT